MDNQRTDYYINKKRKIVDFMIGFLGLPAVYWAYFLITLNIDFRPQILADAFTVFGIFAPIVVFLVIGARRRFVFIGVAGLTAAILLISFGSCLMYTGG